METSKFQHIKHEDDKLILELQYKRKDLYLDPGALCQIVSLFKSLKLFIDKIELDDLVIAYEDYCKKENLKCIDAQEYLFKSTCTTKQYEWMKNFCFVWDMVEEKESK